MLESNHGKKVKQAVDKFKNTGIEFYTLYNSNVIYNEINGNKFENIYDDKQHGFEAFIEKIKNL